MAAKALASRLGRIEKAVGVSCPACAARPRVGIAYLWEGRLTDGRGNDVDPAWLEPCAVCGRAGDPYAGQFKIAALDPSCI